MEEIDLKDLLMYFVKKIPIVLVVSLSVLILGLAYTLFIKTPLYHGNTTLILVSQDNGQNQTASTMQTEIGINQKLVATYTKLIKSRSVLNQVIDRLGLSDSYETLKNKISVSSVTDTEIIEISVSDKNPQDAAVIADTVAEVFKKEIQTIYNLENVSIIDEAVVEEKPYNMQLFKSTILFFTAGFVLAVAILFVIYYFDTSVKSAEEVEKRLGVPVIGNIPLVGKKGK